MTSSERCSSQRTPRCAPVVGDRLRSVFLIGLGASLRSPRPELRGLAASGAFECVALPTSEVRLREGAVVNLLQPRDAARVYRRAHETEVCVLHGDAVVGLDPREVRQPRRRQVQPVSSYFRYKACCIPWNDPSWAASFAAWPAPHSPTDHRDPRCLPFQTFEADGVPDLDTPDQRATFHERHGPATRLRDVASREWGLDKRAFHGRPPP
jgi:hypothetical protein